MAAPRHSPPRRTPPRQPTRPGRDPSPASAARRLGTALALLAVLGALGVVVKRKFIDRPPADAEVADVDEGTPAQRAAKRAQMATEDFAVAARTLADGTRVGGFSTTFDARSPLSEPSSLAKRLSYEKTLADLPDAKTRFFVYVPESYDRRRPMGLIVLINYKETTGLPVPVLPQLAAANVAFVAATPLASPWPLRVALALDAAHNMRQRYAIDPRRVYVMGSTGRPDANNETTTEALRAGLAFPEVFSGTVSISARFYRPVRAANGGFWKAAIPEPDAAALTLARQRPLALMGIDNGEYDARAAEAFRADGFAHVDQRPITVDQYHYPNYTTDWLPGVLKFLDGATARLPLSTTKPSP